MSIKDTDYPRLHLSQEAKGSQRKRTEDSFPTAMCTCIPLQKDLGLLWDMGAYHPSAGTMDEYSDQKSPSLHTGTATTSQWSWEQHQDIAVLGALSEAKKYPVILLLFLNLCFFISLRLKMPENMNHCKSNVVTKNSSAFTEIPVHGGHLVLIFWRTTYSSLIME